MSSVATFSSGMRDRTISDITSDLLLAAVLALSKYSVVVQFIDEADTGVGGEHLFHRWIALTNGEEFTLNGKQTKFEDVDLVIFYAMSAEAQKWRAGGAWPQK